MANKFEEKQGVVNTLSPVAFIQEGAIKEHWDKDEYTLAKLGYKQELVRGLGLFEGWASVFISMNFISGIPVLFGWVMYTGGPTAAFANWTMVGGFANFVSLSMAEIAAALPTAAPRRITPTTGEQVGGRNCPTDVRNWSGPTTTSNTIL